MSFVLIGGAVAGPVSAQSTPAPQFLVSVHPDGAATMALTSTFDLTTDAERQAFRSLENDADANAEAKSRFIARLRSILNATQDLTGREMSIAGGRIELATTPDNDTGVVRLSATWEGLAAERNGRLVVTEPFASEFMPERRFVLRAPDGYRIDRANPEPTTMNESRASWAAGQNLAGFQVVMVEAAETPAPTETETRAPETTQPKEETATPGQPGLGFLTGVLGMLLALYLTRRMIDQDDPRSFTDWMDGNPVLCKTA